MPIGAGRLRDRLEGLGVVAGGVFLEETTGTNSIATAHELRRGVAVHGEEHYLSRSNGSAATAIRSPTP
ncbi:hypothetical protein ACLB9X_31880 [Streptomyces sp. 5K101]|uniref:hypothetical protein n=1 Tax=Streptomyces sp. 5K101 TaxID=3390037 RepID=UPI003976C0AA